MYTQISTKICKCGTIQFPIIMCNGYNSKWMIPAEMQIDEHVKSLDTRILAIDVGKGTEDVLLTEPSKCLYNSIQLVMPSMTQLIAKTISEWKKPSLKIAGDTMAGEPWHKLVYQRCSIRPQSVSMTPEAAMSLRYDLEQVKSKGVNIINTLENPDIRLSDIGWNRLETMMIQSKIDIEDIETVLVCCQEHGNPPKNMSVKDFRMKAIYGTNFSWESKLLRGDQIPTHFPRFRAIVKSINDGWGIDPTQIFVMDSALAVLLGALDPTKEEIVVNVGNGHVSCIGHQKGEVRFTYEHHTGKFSEQAFQRHLEKIISNELTHSEIIREGGHGFVRYGDKWERDKPISVLGPNKFKLVGLASTFATPMANMMMAGPFGLLKAYLSQNA